VLLNNDLRVDEQFLKPLLSPFQIIGCVRRFGIQF